MYYALKIFSAEGFFLHLAFRLEMKLFLRLTLLLAALLSLRVGSAQDPAFSQYKYNKLYYNAAYAGYNEEHHLALAYRNLWPNVPGMPVAGPLANYQVSADFFMRYGQPARAKMAFTGALGGFCNQNFEGAASLMTSAFGITYAQHFPIIQRVGELPQLFLSVGLKGYVNQVRINWDKLVYSDQLDVNYGITSSSAASRTGIGQKWGGDMDLGVLLSNYWKGEDNWYNEFGFATAHLIESSVALSGKQLMVKTPLKLTGSYRTKIALVRKQLFTGITLLYEQQGKFSEFNSGLDFYIRMSKSRSGTPLVLSIAHRISLLQLNDKRQNTKAFIAGFGIEGKLKSLQNATYYIGFAADIPYSGLSVKSLGAYEISLGLNFTKRSSQNRTDCFSF